MVSSPSSRVAKFVAALPLRPNLRVLEIGCGPGVAARLVAARVKPGFVLAIDRSAKAIEQATKASKAEISAGILAFRRVAVEDLALASGEIRFDVAFAMRVGALDGRHPELELEALAAIAAVLTPSGRLFIDGGKPLKELRLPGHAG